MSAPFITGPTLVANGDDSFHMVVEPESLTLDRGHFISEYCEAMRNAQMLGHPVTWTHAGVRLTTDDDPKPGGIWHVLKTALACA